MEEENESDGEGDGGGDRTVPTLSYSHPNCNSKMQSHMIKDQSEPRIPPGYCYIARPPASPQSSFRLDISKANSVCDNFFCLPCLLTDTCKEYLCRECNSRFYCRLDLRQSPECFGKVLYSEDCLLEEVLLDGSWDGVQKKV